MKNQIESNFGTLVLKALNERKMTQQTFADELETTQSCVWQWISGKSNPNFITGLRVCKMLNIDANQILG